MSTVTHTDEDLATTLGPPAAPASAPQQTDPGPRWRPSLPESAASRAALFFIAPSLLVIGGFFFLPVAAALALSLTDFDLYALADPGTARFVGLKNYVELVGDPDFWQALRNTAYFVVVGGPLSVAVSLGAAILVSSKLTKWKGLWRTVFFAPVVTTLVAVAVVWRYLYNAEYGLLNSALGAVGVPAIDWLGDPVWAMPAIIGLAVWKNFGYNMIIFVAGLAGVPEELYEAAQLDGAGWWARFRHITVPELAPTFLFVGVITMIGYFQLFAEPYVMTEGGPLRATVSVVYLMYEEGFKWWNLGYASAVAFVLFALMMVGTLIQLRLQRSDP